MPLYLITGGAGFIGSNLAAELATRGEQVRVLDNFSTGQRRNLAPFSNQIEIVEGDVRSYHLGREAMTDVDFALHSVRDPLTSNEINVLGTLNVLQAI